MLTCPRQQPSTCETIDGASPCARPLCRRSRGAAHSAWKGNIDFLVSVHHFPQSLPPPSTLQPALQGSGVVGTAKAKGNMCQAVREIGKLVVQRSHAGNLIIPLVGLGPCPPVTSSLPRYLIFPSPPLLPFWEHIFL